MLITHLITTLVLLHSPLSSTLILSRGDFATLATSLTSLHVPFYRVLTKRPSSRSLLLSISLQKSSSYGVAKVQLAKSETPLYISDLRLSATRPLSRRRRITLCLRRCVNFIRLTTLAGTQCSMRFESLSMFGLLLTTSITLPYASGKIMRTRRLTLA
jgi:hypothetical protein